MAITKAGEDQKFAYTGGMQEFIAPFDGLYMLEVWGCAGAAGYAKTGGNTEYRPAGGNGGYSKGYIQLKKGSILYVRCGGVSNNGGGNGSSRTTSSSGGSYSCNGGGGGGATHIAKTNTLLVHTADDNLLIVAGGGGGGSAVQNGYSSTGGTGGGSSGGRGDGNRGGGAPGTQVDGHARGLGQTGANGAGGGGGGYWGGRSGDNAYDSALSGGGGSGYIGGVFSIIYRGQVYVPETKNGVNSGNGKAVITLVGRSAPPVYLGSDEIVAIYLGNRSITDIKI